MGGKKGILVLFARAGTADKILDPLDEIPEKHPPPSFSIDEKFERFSVNSSSTIMRIINFNVLRDSSINFIPLFSRNYEVIFLIRGIRQLLDVQFTSLNVRFPIDREIFLD